MKVIQFKLACFHDQQAQRHKTKRSRRTFPRAFVSFLQGPVCLQLVTLACPLLEGEGRRPSGPASIFLAGIDSPPLLSLPEPCRLDLSEGRRQPCRLAPGSRTSPLVRSCSVSPVVEPLRREGKRGAYLGNAHPHDPPPSPLPSGTKNFLSIIISKKN